VGPLFRPLRNNRTGTLGKVIQQIWFINCANIAMTRIYDHRKTLSEDSRMFKVSY
jgi:hypothetical protein